MDKEHLDFLVDKMQAAVESEQNLQNKRLWKEQPAWARDNWRGCAQKHHNGVVPFTVDPQKILWAKILATDISEYWKDPDVQLACIINMELHKFSVFKDNTYLAGNFAPWFSVVTELSMFGVDVDWRDDRDPWIKGGPLLQEYDDLEKLQYPDFYKSGVMPVAHRFYESFLETVKGRLEIIFPDWARGPFCLAVHLRGMENLLMDMYDNPEWVHKLMRFITDSYKLWSTEHAKFTGQPLKKGKLFNDEINSPTLSPKMYREFILPYEIEMGEFRGGISYFHSCGNITAFLHDILTIPQLDMIHIGPWTNLQEAVNIIPADISLDICIDPVDDVMYASEEEIRTHLTGIVDTCYRSNCSAFGVRADAFEILDNPEDDHQKILRWCEIAREVFRQ